MNYCTGVGACQSRRARAASCPIRIRGARSHKGCQTRGKREPESAILRCKRKQPLRTPLANLKPSGVICQHVMNVLGVIPSRLASQRLPRKPLRHICGRPMIEWVYTRARQAAGLHQLLVATDSQEIMDFCRQANIPAQMTSSSHQSGTDRLIEVMSRETADVCVNIQGDEPMVTAGHIELLLTPFHQSLSTRVSTLKVAMDPESARSPDNVKVVTDLTGRALYFSRALIPHDRDKTGAARYFKHLGFYAYTRAALEKFRTLPPSPLEQLEKLEQLRFLENGVPIEVMETTEDTFAVDTEEDVHKVEAFFRRAGTTPPVPGFPS